MGCGTALVKYSVFFINLIFVLAGIALIAVGAVFYIGIDELKPSLPDLIADYITLVPITVIVLGSIVFVVSFMGCCGAIRESICMLSTYGVIMLVLFLLQAGIGTYGVIAYKNISSNLENKISEKFQEEINKWTGNTNIDEGIGLIQEKYKCCGATGPKDWNNKIPKSCCRDTSNCSDFPTEAQVFQNGCTSKVFDAVDNVVNVIVAVVFTIAAFELAAAIVAFCLSSCIRNNIRRGYY